MTKSFRSKTILAVFCGAWLVGCGGSDEADVAIEDNGSEQVVEPARSANQSPTLSRIWFEPETPVPGAVLQVKTDASDPDGDSLKFGYVWRLNGRAMREGGELINLEKLQRGDRLEVIVTASDGKASAQSKTLSVTLGNQAPVVQSIRIAFSDGPQGASGVVVATPIAKDADGDELTFSYQWSVRESAVSDAEGETFDSTPYKRGDTFQVTVIANDGELDSAPLTSDPIELPNRSPKIVSTPPNINESGEFRYQVKAEDPDGDRLLRYSLGQGPEGMVIDSISGEVVWKPSATQAGTHSVVLGVKDNQGGVALQEFRLDIKVTETAPPAPPKPATAAAEEEDAEAVSPGSVTAQPESEEEAEDNESAAPAATPESSESAEE